MIVYIEGREVEIKEPSPPTLKKYGLALNDWKEIVCQQGYRCPICTHVLDKTTNIDHYHIKNWKKLPADIRKLFVRGVTCWYCNKNYLAKGITLERSQNVTAYLMKFEKRKPNGDVLPKKTSHRNPSRTSR